MEMNWQYQLDLNAVDRMFAEVQDTGRITPIYFTLVARDGSVFGNWSSLPGKDQVHSEWYNKAMEHSPFPTYMSLKFPVFCLSGSFAG